MHTILKRCKFAALRMGVLAVALLMLQGASGQQTQRQTVLFTQDLPLHFTAKSVKKAALSCDVLTVTQITPDKLWPQQPWGPEQKLRTEIKLYPDTIAIEFQDDRTLMLATVRNVEIGKAKPAVFSILKDADEYLIASNLPVTGYEPSLDALIPSADLLILNKNNGLAVWTTTGHEMFSGQAPDTYTEYLQCK